MLNDLEKIDFNIETIKSNEEGELLKIAINVPMSIGWIERMKFIVESNNERKAFQLKHIKNEDNKVYFETTIFLETKALYYYYFSFEVNNNFIYFKKNNKANYNTITNEDKWKLSVNFKTPDWAKGKIMYHIFVDRFYHSNEKILIPMKNRTIHKSWNEEMRIGPDENGIWNNDYYGGNLKGIEEKLDYIKSLGTSIIYLSPIVYSQSNHRYDSSDYEMVDPYVGNNNDLKSLCQKAHEKGMKIILDAVFNHTGNDSKYFNEYNNFTELGAYQSKESKYYNFFKKYHNNNNTFFDYWWGMKNLPVCDGSNKEWQNYIYGENGIIDLWFSLGIDGLRLDVADELTDEFIEGIRKAVKRNKEDGFILGEVWKNPMRMGRNYIESGKCMDSVMNYILVDALIRYFKHSDTISLYEVLKQIKNEYPKETIDTLMNFTSTHDISRAINIFSKNDFKTHNSWAWDPLNDNLDYQKKYNLTNEEYEYGKKIYKSYVSTIAFLPGILSIFYGDEIGIQGLGNLANRKPFPWDKKDYELLDFFKTIGKVKNEQTFLEKADINIIDINNNHFIFERNNLDDNALITVNRTNNITKTPIPEKYLNSELIYNLGNTNKNEIDSHGVLVLKKNKN